MVRGVFCLPLILLTVVLALPAVARAADGHGQHSPVRQEQGGPLQGHHGQGHDAMHHWYLTLKDWQGRSCCNEQDCRPTLSRFRDDQIEVLVDGEWTKVPRHKILPQSSPDARTHVCSPVRPSNYPRGYIFCVVLGTGV